MTDIHVSSATQLVAALSAWGANGGDVRIIFDRSFTLTADLPLVFAPSGSLTIVGNGFTLSGADQFHGLAFGQGSVSISGLNIVHTLAHGGDGGNGPAGGGGGAGLGGGLFVGSRADVRLTDVHFADNRAVGGDGGSYTGGSTGGGGGGGGGLGGDGGGGGQGGGGGGGIGTGADGGAGANGSGTIGIAVNAANGGEGGELGYRLRYSTPLFFASVVQHVRDAGGGAGAWGGGGSGGLNASSPFGVTIRTAGGGGGIGGGSAPVVDIGTIDAGSLIGSFFPAGQLIEQVINYGYILADGSPTDVIGELAGGTYRYVASLFSGGSGSSGLFQTLRSAALELREIYGLYQSINAEVRASTGLTLTQGGRLISLGGGVLTDVASGASLAEAIGRRIDLSQYQRFVYGTPSDPSYQSGGQGGYGGGGGGGTATGGEGGFGGGGGGGGVSDGLHRFDGGAGGFGGGGGGGGTWALGGAGGFGGGAGSSGVTVTNGGVVAASSSIGGGGLGAGGAVFLQSGGRLTIGSGVTIDGNSVAGGQGFLNGGAFGEGIFAQGAQTITLDATTGNILVSGVADQNGSVAGYDAGRLSLLITGSHTVQLGGFNSLSGTITIGDAAVADANRDAYLSGGVRFANGSLEVLAGAVLNPEAHIVAVAGGTLRIDAGSFVDNDIDLGQLRSGDLFDLIIEPGANFRGDLINVPANFSMAGLAFTHTLQTYRDGSALNLAQLSQAPGGGTLFAPINDAASATQLTVRTAGDINTAFAWFASHPLAPDITRGVQLVPLAQLGESDATNVDIYVPALDAPLTITPLAGSGELTRGTLHLAGGSALSLSGYNLRIASNIADAQRTLLSGSLVASQPAQTTSIAPAAVTGFSSRTSVTVTDDLGQQHTLDLYLLRDASGWRLAAFDHATATGPASYSANALAVRSLSFDGAVEASGVLSLSFGNGGRTEVDLSGLRAFDAQVTGNLSSDAIVRSGSLATDATGPINATATLSVTARDSGGVTHVYDLFFTKLSPTSWQVAAFDHADFVGGNGFPYARTAIASTTLAFTADGVQVGAGYLRVPTAGGAALTIDLSVLAERTGATALDAVSANNSALSTDLVDVASALTVDGGTVTLGGDSSFTGGITIISGTLNLASSASWSDVAYQQVTLSDGTRIDLYAARVGARQYEVTAFDASTAAAGGGFPYSQGPIGSTTVQLDSARAPTTSAVSVAVGAETRSVSFDFSTYFSDTAVPLSLGPLPSTNIGGGDAAGTGTITFAPTAAGVLHLASGTLSNAIVGFNGDDRIELGRVTASGLVASGADGTLTVAAPSGATTLRFGNLHGGSVFSLAPVSGGGTAITLRPTDFIIRDAADFSAMVAAINRGGTSAAVGAVYSANIAPGGLSLGAVTLDLPTDALLKLSGGTIDVATLDVAGGTVDLGGAGLAGANIHVAAGASLLLSGGMIAGGVSLANGATFRVASGTLNASVAGGTLIATPNAGATVEIAGTVDHTLLIGEAPGGTLGTVRIAGTARLGGGATFVSGGTLLVEGAGSVGTIAFGGRADAQLRFDAATRTDIAVNFGHAGSVAVDHLFVVSEQDRGLVESGGILRLGGVTLHTDLAPGTEVTLSPQGNGVLITLIDETVAVGNDAAFAAAAAAIAARPQGAGATEVIDISGAAGGTLTLGQASSALTVSSSTDNYLHVVGSAAIRIAQDATVRLGGDNGYSGGTILASGANLELLEAHSAGTGSIRLEGTGATLSVRGATVDSAISGLDPTDAIDLLGRAFVGNQPVIVRSDIFGRLDVSTGGAPIYLQFEDVAANSAFQLSRDGHGGTLVTALYGQRTITVASAAELASAIELADRLSGDGQSLTIKIADGVSRIQLATELPAIALRTGVALTIDGNGATIDGGQAVRNLLAYSGLITLQNITLANGLAQGGAGGDGYVGGGGGAGLGGNLLVASGADLTLRNVTLIDGRAVGGAGGRGGDPTGSEGGGGGLGGDGGDGIAGGNLGVAGGGGGVGCDADGGQGFNGVPTGTYTANGVTYSYPGRYNYSVGGPGILPGAISGGSTRSSTEAGAQGYFGIGTGGPDGGGGAGGIAASGGGGQGQDAVNLINTSNGQTLLTAGAGGWGGGGGGAGFSTANNTSSGGAGGFGGGGGAGLLRGGSGGFGGGGGAGTTLGGQAGYGGGTGGNAVYTSSANGGGGLGAGGNLFVQQGGTVTIIGGVSIGGGSVAGGAGSNGAGSGSARGADLFLQGAGVLTFAPPAGETLVSSVDLANGDSTVGITMRGAGTLDVRGAPTYGGVTTIAAGTLRIDAAGLAGNIVNNSHLVLTGGTAGAGAGDRTIATSITGSGTLDFDFATGRQVTLSGTLDLQGLITVNPGVTARLSGAGAHIGTATVDGTLVLSGANATTGLLAGTGDVDISGNGATIDRVQVDDFRILGADSRLVHSLQATTLLVSGDRATFDGLVTAGPINISGADVVFGGINSSDTITVASAGSVSFTGTLGGNIDLRSTGTLTISASNAAYHDVVTLHTGTLALTASAALGSGTIAFAAGNDLPTLVIDRDTVPGGTITGLADGGIIRVKGIGDPVAGAGASYDPATMTLTIAGTAGSVSLHAPLPDSSTYHTSVSSDGEGGVLVRVTPNSAPVIESNGGDDAAIINVPQRTLAVTTVVAADPDAGTTLHYSISGGDDARFFTIDSTTGQLRFTEAQEYFIPNDANADSQYDLTVAVSDGALVDTQALHVRITNVNAPPVITSNGGGATAALSVLENTTDVTRVVAVDLDRDDTVVTGISGADAQAFRYDPNSGLLTFRVAPDHEAPADANGDNIYDITIYASDGQATVTQQLAITVADVNEAPVILPAISGNATFHVLENTTAVTTIAATDPEGSTSFRYSIVDGLDAAYFDIGAQSGALRFRAPPDYEPGFVGGHASTYLVDVAVSDGVSSAVRRISVAVDNDRNEGPTITSFGGASTVSFAIDENRSSFGAVPSGLDFETIGYTNSLGVNFFVAGGADAALFEFNGGVLQLRPIYDQVTGQRLPGLDFEAPTDANHDNVYEVTVGATGITGVTSFQTYLLTVGNVNEAPTITSNGGGDGAIIHVLENTTAVTTVVGADQDAGATLIYGIAGRDAGLFRIDQVTGALTFVTPPDYENRPSPDYRVDVLVTDGTFVARQSLLILVDDDKTELPVILSNGGGASAAVNVHETTTAVTTVQVRDYEFGSRIEYGISGGADAALFRIDSYTGQLSFRAPPLFSAPQDAGADNVYDVVVSARGYDRPDDAVVTQSLRIAVTDTAPRIISDGGQSSATLSIVENRAEVTAVDAVDADGDTRITFSIVGGADAALFTIDPVSGALAFRRAPDFEAPTDSNGDNVYDVIVGASDASLSGTQAISITVTNGAEAFADLRNSVAENGTVTIDVLANDDLAGGTTAAISRVNDAVPTVGTPITLASGATVTLNADRTITYNPNGRFDSLVSAATGAANTTATDHFTYQLPDGGAATVTVTINGVDSVGDRLLGSSDNDRITGTGSADRFDLSQGGDDSVSGGDGNDGFYFGAAFTAADRVDGGAGSNDQIGLEGDYTGANALVLGADTIANVEVIAALAGHSYDITTVDANIAPGHNLTFFGTLLGAGDNFTVDASAETDGTVTIYGGLGTDHFTGGAGDDGFYFGPGRFDTATDTVNGGAGSNDQLALDGSYTATIGAAQVQNVEVLVLLRGLAGDLANYNITLADDLVGAGQTFTVFGLATETGFTLDATAVTDANIRIFGGSGNDTITTGAGNDRIFGGGGADVINGGAGADTFVYDAVSQSTGVSYDGITGFVSGTDKFDFNFTVTGVDASVGSGALSMGSFDANLAGVIGAGQLAANHAVLFQADAGDLAGQTFLIVDANGVAGYQAGEDYVIQLTAPPPTLAVGDFI